jgi:hypothetical protein
VRPSNLRSAFILASVGVMLMVSACGPSIDEAIWTEEVRLHDGRSIEVWRRDTRHAGGFPERRGVLIDIELKYLPSNLHWKATQFGRPISLEIFDGVPYLVVVLRNTASCGPLKNATDFAAQFLRWHPGQWTEVSQEAFPVDKALVNLYRSPWGRSSKDDAKGLITWERKARDDLFRPDYPETVRKYFERIWHYCAAPKD